MDRRYHWIGVGLCCLVGFVMGGCGVAQHRYDAVMTERESVRSDLEHSRLMREALEQENKTLRSDNEKMARDVEVMGSEIQRIKESRQHERALLDVHDAELAKVNQARARQVQALQREYRTLQRRNRTLRETVRRYHKELRSVREAPRVQRQSYHGVSPADSMKDARVAPAPAAPPPDTMRLNGGTGRVNLNTASMHDFVVVLGLRQPVAEKVIANRPYRLRGELLAKHVMPNETFDVIKDRITAISR